MGERMQQRLGVPSRNEGVIDELTTDCLVVEDLTIEGKPPVSAGVTHRLVRTLAYVNDRKAGMDKPNVVEDLNA
jgi:hypothetical protein